MIAARTVAWSLPALVSVVLLAACSPGADTAVPGGTGRGAGAPLDGIDDPVIVTEAQLDEMFPLVQPIVPETDEAPRDPAQGGMLEARFAAYRPARDPATVLSVQPNPNVAAAFIAEGVRGLLFGMDNFDDFLGPAGAIALSSAAARRPIRVVFFDQAKAETGFRAHVKPCPDGPPGGRWEDCQPEVHLPFEIPAGQAAARPIRAATFVHEIGHVGHLYQTQSDATVTAGGLAMGTFRHSEFRWQREGSAQFITARAPDSAAYERIGTDRCAFEVMQRGAHAWKDLLPTGAAPYLPYQMAVLIDQVTWHKFADDQGWLLRWWFPRPDARDPARPESAARALIRMLSPPPAAAAAGVDFAGLNRMLVKAGYDLYFDGKDPWTTKTLTADCYRTTGVVLPPGNAGASAMIAVQPLAFDAMRIDIADGAAAGASELQVTLTADRLPNLRAFVYAVDVPGYTGCLKALDAVALTQAQPRQACNARHTVAIGGLSASNGHQASLPLTDALRARLGSLDIAAVVFHLARPNDPRTPITATLTVQPKMAAMPAAAPQHLCVVLRNSGPRSMMMRTPDMDPVPQWRVGAGAAFGRFITPRSPRTFFIAHEGTFITTDLPETEVGCDLTAAVVARAAQRPRGSTGPGTEFCTSSDAAMPRVVWNGSTLTCENW